jgi:hypothetical protein
MATNTTTPVVLSYGLGVDSTAILLRWITEPESRDFDLSDLIVVTAMTGDEWPATGRLVEQHVLPLLRANHIRYVQVARAGAFQRDGITVLSDTRTPDKLFLDGDYKLSDELLTAGTVPQMGGVRKCSAKAKGWPLDTLIEGILGRGVPFRHIVGFEANEPKRAVKDTAANTGARTGEYPLLDWGWDRARCEEYILQQTGAHWIKSACVYCPFALANKAGRERVLPMYRDDLDSAVRALFVEHVSLQLNERQGLNGPTRLIDLLREDGNQAALDGLEDRLDRTPHAVYHVRRIIRPQEQDRTKVSNYSRSVRQVTPAVTRVQAKHFLHDEYPGELQPDGQSSIVRRRGEVLPAVEELYVVAPTVVTDKQERNFETWWADALRAQEAITR